MRILLITLLLLVDINLYAGGISGIVVDEKGQPLPYSTIRVKNKRIAVLSDSIGHFNLKTNGIQINDTIAISYLGYKTKEIPLNELENSMSEWIVLAPAPMILQEVMICPTDKMKRKTTGKRHSWGALKTYIDGQMAGECFGYEFHAKKRKKLILDKVGFYYCEGDSQMTKMKFRVNVYDMSGVKKSPSSNFINVLSKPIYFDYNLKGPLSGKFEYELPERIVLPRDAMVEIEFLENLNGEIFWFKSNLIGKRTWAKSIIDGEWEQNPFATPFFVECIEVDAYDI